MGLIGTQRQRSTFIDITNPTLELSAQDSLKPGLEAIYVMFRLFKV